MSYVVGLCKSFKTSRCNSQLSDKEGQRFSGSFIDISARIILHEYDHLNGYTFFDSESVHVQAKNEEKYISERHEDKRKKWHDDMDKGLLRIYEHFTIKRIEETR